MFDQMIVDEIKNRLVKAYSPKAIYLFGSYAWGQPDDQSDLDLMIVIESSDEPAYVRPRVGELALSGLLVSRDIIVYTSSEFKKRADDVTTLCYKIKKEGKLLYGHV
jgi:predicted nucleotidyltransferase